MAFRFSLATLLRMREIAEQREERLLSQIQNQVVLSRQTLADLEVQRGNLCAHREAAMQLPTSAFEILGFHRQMLQINDLEAAEREHLAKLVMLREQQMKIYEAAHLSRELLFDMRSDQMQAFQKEQTRQEQNAMDDTFSSRKKSH